MKEKGDLLYFSSVEWRMFQRPQSLSLEFSRRGYRVFYIEPMLSLGNIAQHLFTGKSLTLPELPQDNMILLRPLLSLSTFRFGATQRIDKRLFKIWFSNIYKRYVLRSDALVMLNLPYWWGNIIDRSLFPKNCIIYDCIDNPRVHSRNKKMLRRMERAEQVLATEADVCFATADDLLTNLKTMNSRTYLLPNALSPEHFLAKNASAFPDALVDLPKPLVGFVGSLYDHIDFGIFKKVAEILKEGTVVLVGFTNRKDELRQLITEYKNILYIGAISYDEVPIYINSFDICLNPFKIDEIGNSVNPLKLYEYLIFGKPVISSKTKEMGKYAEYVYFFSDCDEIEEAVQRALSEHSNDKIKLKRIKFALENSWRNRVDYIEQVLSLK